jgi:hypothetical protein
METSTTRDAPRWRMSPDLRRLANATAATERFRRGQPQAIRLRREFEIARLTEQVAAVVASYAPAPEEAAHLAWLVLDASVRFEPPRTTDDDLRDFMELGGWR